MSEIRVTVDDSGKRARNIMIGAAVVCVLTFWRITGALPFVTSVMVPQPKSDALMSSWTFGVEIFSDILYMIGVGATGLVSGIWSLLTAIVQSLYSRFSGGGSRASAAAAVTDGKLEERTKKILAAVSKPLNELSAAVEALAAKVKDLEMAESVAAIANVSAPPKTRVTPSVKRTRKPDQ